MSEWSRARAGADRAAPRPLIVAEATPPGRGAISLIRWSGAGLDEHLETLFPALRPLPEARRSVLATLRDARGAVDEGLLVRFDAGASFTGEASAEFSLHGSPALVRRALDAAFGAGARLAAPGEFTRRAFLSGRLSIGQAEAVGELVEAGGEREAEAALARIGAGGVDARFERWRSSIRSLLAEVEAAIEFGEEGHGAERLVESAGALAEELAGATREAERRGAPRVVLVGRANAGKSTIFNRLVGEEAAIVSPIPGTTRDPLRELIRLFGFEILLVDTAGDGEASGELERLAAERSRTEERLADLLIVVSAPEEGADDQRAAAAGRRASGRPSMIVFSKEDAPRTAPSSGIVAISARTGAGWQVFMQELHQNLQVEAGGLAARRSSEGGWTRERLRRSAQAVEAAAMAQTLELAAEALRSASRQLAAACGEALTEEMLDELFSRFCVGK